MKEFYDLGEIVWHNGDECEIVGGPFELHGGLFQNATVKATGKKIVIVPPLQFEKNLAEKQLAWKKAQEGFSRLHKAARNCNEHVLSVNIRKRDSASEGFVRVEYCPNCGYEREF